MRKLPLGRISLLVLLAAVSAVRGEVAVVRSPSGGVEAVVQMFKLNASHPKVWSSVRKQADPDELLNESGDRLRDGAPSIVLHPVTGMPEAVWSYFDGERYQVAYSRFDGQSWSRVPTPSGPDYELITSDDSQNLDPRLWIDPAGNRRVVWWRQRAGDPDDVVVSVLPPGETQWWAPQRVSTAGVPTRRPDIRTFLGMGTFISAEEDDAGILSAVVFKAPALDGRSSQRGSDPWGRKLLRSAGARSSLGTTLTSIHTPAWDTPGVLWREGDLMAMSVYDCESYEWSEPVFSPLPAW